MSTLTDLRLACSAARDGKRPLPVVRFLPQIEDLGTYFDRGMIARVEMISLANGFSDSEDGDMFKVTFNFAEFDEHNLWHEQANFYDKNGHPSLTATEAGCKPTSGREEVYLMEESEDHYFEIIDSVTVPVLFPDGQAFDMVVKALAQYREILTMRTQEVGSTIADVSPSEAATVHMDLEALDRAIAAVNASKK